MWSVKAGFFSQAEDVWLSYDASARTLSWKSMRMQQNKAAMAGSVPLAELGPVVKTGAELALHSGDARVVAVKAPKAVIADTWEHALEELRSLKEAIAGQPTVNVARLQAARNAAGSRDATGQELLRRQRESEGSDSAAAAGRRLSRLNQAAKARKAKYAGTGLKHIAEAMARRESKQ